MTGRMQTSIHVLLRTVSFTPHRISWSGSLMRDSEEKLHYPWVHASAWTKADLKHADVLDTAQEERWSSYLFIKREDNQKHTRATLYWSIMYITLQPMILQHTVHLLIKVYHLLKGIVHRKMKTLPSFTQTWTMNVCNKIRHESAFFGELSL